MAPRASTVWKAVGFVALALYAIFVWPVPAIRRHGETETPLTPQEQGKFELAEHPRIISKEVVTNFHRVGDGLILQTESGRFEFVASDDCRLIASPEDVKRGDADPNGVGLFVDTIREQAKQPIFIIHEDVGELEWVLQQARPNNGNLDLEECVVTPNF